MKKINFPHSLRNGLNGIKSSFADFLEDLRKSREKKAIFIPPFIGFLIILLYIVFVSINTLFSVKIPDTPKTNTATKSRTSKGSSVSNEDPSKDVDLYVFIEKKAIIDINTRTYSPGTHITLNDSSKIYRIKRPGRISINYQNPKDIGRKISITYDGVKFSSLDKDRKVIKPREIEIVPYVPVEITVH